MFGIWKRKKDKVLGHWYVIFDNFETDTSEFYQAIEHDLERRELGGLQISRIAYDEGGLLSAKREYLRMRRERLIFDVCAAPFGNSWLFSCRFATIPVEILFWELDVFLVVMATLVWFYAILFGFILGLVLLGASLLSLLLLMKNIVALGLKDLDAALLQTPFLGSFYEAFFREETYYLEDTRLAYIDIVNAVVRARVDELGAAGKVKLVEYKDATPPSHPAILKMVADLLRMGR